MTKLKLDLDQVQVDSMETTPTVAASPAAECSISGTYDRAGACTRTCQEMCF